MSELALQGVGAADRVRWTVDGREIEKAGSTYRWPVTRGDHRVAATVWQRRRGGREPRRETAFQARQGNGSSPVTKPRPLGDFDAVTAGTALLPTVEIDFPRRRKDAHGRTLRRQLTAALEYGPRARLDRSAGHAVAGRQLRATYRARGRATTSGRSPRRIGCSCLAPGCSRSTRCSSSTIKGTRPIRLVSSQGVQPRTQRARRAVRRGPVIAAAGVGPARRPRGPSCAARGVRRPPSSWTCCRAAARRTRASATTGS